MLRLFNQERLAHPIVKLHRVVSGNSAASNTIDQLHHTRKAVLPKAFMRTLIFVLAIALIPLSLHAQQEAAPPGAQNAGKDQDQIPDKDQGKVPVFRKNVNVVNVLLNVKDKHG